MDIGEALRQLPQIVAPFAQKAVGRIEKYKVRLIPGRYVGKPAKQIPGHYLAAMLIIDSGNIPLQPAYRRTVGFEKSNRLRAPAQAFKPHAAGAGEAVVNNRIGNQRRENIEKRLLHPIGDRARDVTLRREKFSPAMFPGNDPHGQAILPEATAPVTHDCAAGHAGEIAKS